MNNEFPYSITVEVAPGVAKVIRSGTCSIRNQRGWQVQNDDETILHVLLDELTDYVLNGVPTVRPVLFAETQFQVDATGEDVLTLSFPELTELVFEGQTEIDSSFEFSSAHAGLWALRVTPPFPYQTQKLMIQANEVS